MATLDNIIAISQCDINKIFLLSGNIIPHEWYTKFKENGKADINAIILLADIVAWCRNHEKIDNSFNPNYPYFNGVSLALTYEYLSNRFCLSKETIRRAFVRLEKHGILTRKVSNIKLEGGRRVNRLFVILDSTFFESCFIDPDLDIRRANRKENSKVNSQITDSDLQNQNDNFSSQHFCGDHISNKNLKKEDRYLNKSNFCKNSFSSNSEEVEVTKSASIRNKQLKDFYPLKETDCEELKKLSGRSFTLRAMNEILLDMSNKLKDRWFKGKKSFFKYLSLAFRYEKRVEELINRESYKIRNNYTNEENNIKEQEEYLTKIEYSREVSPEWHFKKRLAAVFTRDKAYKILTSYIRIKIDNGVFKLYLNKPLELSKYDYEILLNQAKSTHERLCSESSEYKEITKLEIIKPIINTENKQINNKTEMYEGLWGRVRKQLIEYFGSNGEGLDKSWFSKLNADIDENNKIVKLKAPTNFIKDWIYQNHFYRIEKLFKDQDYQCQLLTN